jgi:hypothetical protein
MGGWIGGRLGAALAAAVVLAGSALGQGADGAVTDADIAYFVENSSARYARADDPDFNHLLYQAATAHHDAAGALKAFADAAHVDVPTATAYASLLIQDVLHGESCHEGADCPLDPELQAAIKSTGLSEPTGWLLSGLRSDPPTIIETAFAHPRAEMILSHLSAHSLSFAALAPLLALAPSIGPDVFRSCLEDYPGYRESEVLAVVDAAAQRSVGEPAHAAAGAALVFQLLHNWLDEQALKTLDGLSDEERKQALTFNSPVYQGQDGLDAAHKRFFALNVDLAAAFLAANRRAEAQERVAALRSLGAKTEVDRLTLDLLDELASPKLTQAQVFDMFLFGHPDGTAPPDWLAKWPLGESGVKGWALAARMGSPALRSVAANYLRSRSHEKLARYVLTIADTLDEPLQGLPEWVTQRAGAKLAASVASYDRQIDEAKARYAALWRPVAASPGPGPSPEDRPVPFVEREMPADLRNAKPIEQAVPNLASIGVSASQIVRAERTGDDWIAVYLSHALDPAGEVSGGGFWVARSKDGGKHWEPIYLGLQQFFPYDVKPKSALTMLDGDHLRIEVAIREIDRESITFPPIGLQSKRVQEGLYLDFTWDALTADHDGDGLSDIVEHRMALSAYNADSDGDGIPDGVDSLPTVPFVRSDEDYALGLALIQRLYGYERGALIVGAPTAPADRAPRGKTGSKEPSLEELLKAAIGTPLAKIEPSSTLFLEGDPRPFAGLRLPFRLVVLTPEQVERLSSEYGVFFPVGIRWSISDPASGRLFVIWDASWVGGSFIVRKTARGYETEDISSWIT